MSDRMPEKCRIKCQRKCKRKCQIEFQIDCRNICHIEWQHICHFFLSHQLPVSGDHSKNSSEIHVVVSLPLSAISFFMCMHGLGPHCAPNSAVLCHISDMCPWVLYVRHILHMSLTMPCRKRAGLEAWMSIYTYVGTNVRQLAALMPFFVSAHMPQRKDLIVNLPDMQGETCLSVHMHTCQ